MRDKLTGRGATPRTPGNDALVGTPTMPSLPSARGEKPQQLPSLPCVEKEANAIAPLLKTKPLIGNQATKAAVLQQLPKARAHFEVTLLH